ncbi:P-loop containing nucleoside triphosphate hydrolase [Sesbania bispinosa]|nr:P-loop containing nucleoside triphosphate hydrolase [Sesbania bispinosa]
MKHKLVPEKIKKGDGSSGLAHQALWGGRAAACNPSTVRSQRPIWCNHQPNQALARTMFHPLDAPTWVTSWCYPTRYAGTDVRSIIKTYLCHTTGDVGLPNAESCDGSKGANVEHPNFFYCINPLSYACDALFVPWIYALTTDIDGFMQISLSVSHIFSQLPWIRQFGNLELLPRVAWHTRLCGLEVQQPVIPPLSRAGSVRCSVKPASRSTLRLGTMRPQPSLKSHGSTLKLERAGQHVAVTGPTKRSQSHVSPPCANLLSKVEIYLSQLESLTSGNSAYYAFLPTIQGKYLFDVGQIIKDLEDKKKELILTRDNVQNRVEEAKKKTEKIEGAVEIWLSEVKSLLEEVESLEHEMRENNSCLPGCCPNLRKRYLSKQMAMQDDGSYMIGLYGMGGCGKNNPCKEMGKKAKELKLFDQVVFATVSQTPNVGRIQDEIADLLGLTLVEKREPGRARRISLRLQDGERILLILDDVWARLSLEDIGIPLNADSRNCKVLLTTRRQQESWILLQKHACIDNDSSTSLLNGLAEGVVKECKGLPLAIETVGMSLRGKSVHDWKIALDRLKNSKPLDIEEGVRDIFACLQLSYDYLGSRLAKSLFLICGLFPEEHRIPIEDLFRFGVRLGFCGEVESFDIARSRVNATINKLIDSCLLMHCEESKHEVKMHDVVRDVALWIASQEGSVINVNQAKAKAKARDVLQCVHAIKRTTFEGIKGLKVMSLVCRKDNERVSLSLPLSIHLLTNLCSLSLVGWKLGDISSLLLDLSECEIEEDCYGAIARCSQLEELYVFGRDRNFGSTDSHECFSDSSNTQNCSCKEELNTSTISAITKDLLQRAAKLYLGDLCGGCKNIIPTMFRAVGGMNQLTSLRLNHCSEIESIIDTTSTQADSFQADADLLRLVVLELRSMDGLKQLCHGPPSLSFFQNLRRLDYGSASCCVTFFQGNATCAILRS